MSKELFNPEYIHCTWDDSLKGKTVFYGDIIGDFKEEVEKGDLDSRGICCEHTGNISYPFNIEDDNEVVASWQFVYYDPNYEVKAAYRDGKQIQFKSQLSGGWRDCAIYPYWEDNCEHRVKPDEPEKPVVKATDLCGYCIHREDGCTPTSDINCVNFFSTNDDYFRLQKDYADLIKGHSELERKYNALVTGIQALMHKPVNC